jgi:hypothetical protein
MNLSTHDTPSPVGMVQCSLNWLRRLLAAAPMEEPAAGLLLCTLLITAPLFGIGFYRIHLDRTNLPDLEAFVRVDFPTVGHIYDTDGKPLMEMATEYRWITVGESSPISWTFGQPQYRRLLVKPARKERSPSRKNGR